MEGKNAWIFNAEDPSPGKMQDHIQAGIFNAH
jgi:hypothetical protein